ncbi:hypothetical protein DPMN_135450 [Dreissena polymorpha]|uniref:Uncharacterized protein n=1 Tax=Dreissena polymorpha TaxID=45954 RepID=A0A9D4FZ27_DREPO|nr:hypothetical protein DPMN_135450 [Dreissena polymorpha]
MKQPLNTAILPHSSLRPFLKTRRCYRRYRRCCLPLLRPHKSLTVRLQQHPFPRLVVSVRRQRPMMWPPIFVKLW